jgi:predicted glycoside hydrolase/deacetylase ChbG (UPF0249 family)
MTMRVVIHVDDVGMCHGTNVAFGDLAALGAVSAASVMVPCPWSSEALELAAGRPDLDVGVHLTLTSEHRYYRWGPVSRPSLLAGLTDHSGALWRSVVDVRGNADPDAVVGEWRAQVDRALASGVDITHLDTHMGSAFAPQWSEHYVALGVEYDVPVLMTRSIEGYGVRRHLPDVTQADHARAVAAAQEAGMPLVDVVIETDFSRPAGLALDLEAMLDAALASDAQLAVLALHPCASGEIESIDAARAHVRTDEYLELAAPRWRALLDDLSAAGRIDVIGMRELRDEYRRRRH